ncbi:MAG: carbamoyltransferase HypF [Roseiarcus sp.]|jgi:hydrogenase maturation protein HypF
MSAPRPLDARADRRLRLRVRGAVQGVGFRPFAYSLASRLALSGFVRNDAEGVLIEVEGAGAEQFLHALRLAPPPLARIDSIDVADLPLAGGDAFAIRATAGGPTTTRIGADAAICEACLSELFDPASRFYRYPLINCTHCGPRYTLTRALPYDRAQTSMAPFPMCSECARDYADPANRRFHAEPIACPRCGPKLNVEIEQIADCIRDGGIVALKGLGGFHLVCDARNETTAAELRRRKAREAKPFAVMVANAASAALLAELSEAEIALLESRARPIVLVKSRGVLAPSVAPHLRDVGLMLAYTPLHWLTLHALAGAPAFAGWRHAPNEIALIATSANLGGEPLVADDEDARRRLGPIADLVVTHGRAIVARADDSVMRVLDGAPAYLRRARGFVPEPIDLGVDGPSVLAAGADLKNTVTLTRGREAFVSPHIGDLDDRETLRFRNEAIAHLRSILAIEPEFAACDLHPDFQSTRSAECAGLPCARVQHHLAHVAAVAAEHGLSGPVLGVALDGQGYGTDGTPWGGELILLDGARWERVGWLEPLALPGGDRAAREPWRVGVAMLDRLGRLDATRRFFPDAPNAVRLAQAFARGARFPMTTSLGRLFDAAAALAGVRLEQRYEGQAAMELEALVETPRSGEGLWRIEAERLDMAPLMAAIVESRLVGREAAELFHGALIAALGQWIAAAAAARGLTQVALGGGCLMNKVLADGLGGALRARGLRPYVPRAVPANDGGVSLGQAAFALAKFRAGASFEEE